MRLVAARLPAAVGEDTFITEGTPAEVVALADLLAVFIMGFSIGGFVIGAARIAWYWRTEPGHDA